MKEIGTMMRSMAMALRYIIMETNTRVNMLEINLMEREPIHGKTERHTLENGSKLESMDLAFGKGFRERVILVSGFKIKYKDMVSMFGKTETSMKEYGIKHSKTVKVLTYLKTEMFSQVLT